MATECGFQLKMACYWLLAAIAVTLPHTAFADVIAVTRKNITYTYSSMPANFGDRLPMNGLQGQLVTAVPLTACHSIQRPPKLNTSDMINYNYFALIKRDDCNFDLKVLNAQRAGYAGAIVFNSDSDDSTLPMNGDLYAREVIISSVFVGASSGATLRAMNYTTGTQIYMTDEHFSYNTYLIPFISIVGICFMIMVCFMVAKYVRDRRRIKRSRLSKTNLKKIPVKKFVKGDDYDVCAICLDDYDEGDKLRILPCNHAFHCKCVDPWLTNNRRTCPVCKRKVIPSGEAGSDISDSEDDDANSTASPTEHTPLLSGAAAGGSTPTVDVEGAWGGQERPTVKLVDAATAMTENDSSDDPENDQEDLLISRSPINGASPILDIVTPTLHTAPSGEQEAAINLAFDDDEIIPTVVVVDNDENPQTDTKNKV